jgi:hypothetical protein
MFLETARGDTVVRDAHGLRCDALRSQLNVLAPTLERLGPLTIKVPEGFEFYCLFPEQYRLAAAAWLRTHAPSPRDAALIIGIRGIGTTLSAVVAAELRSNGWRCERVTVRPTGHPFHRSVTFEGLNDHASFALVVDEGPGISGSSMAAVAAALVGRGYARDQISFMPGHAGEPGPAADPEVREWWNTTARYVGAVEGLHWRGLDLLGVLRRRTQQLRDDSPVHQTRDVSNGGWRCFAFCAEEQWPAVSGRFERAKHLCSLTEGDSLLWKWAGLGSWVDRGCSTYDLIQARAERLCPRGFVEQPIALCHGFLATRWLNGERLAAGAADEEALRLLGSYIAAASGPRLSSAEQQIAMDRLESLVRTNVAEATGESETVRTFVAAHAPRVAVCCPRYGDGRMAPWEWVRTPSGTLSKTDWWGHDTDHTAVGKQSVLWDAAGAVVEWNLNAVQRDCLLEPLRRDGVETVPGVFAFYELAYAGFRFGQTTLCGNLETAGAERARLDAAQARYREHCGSVLRGRA